MLLNNLYSLVGFVLDCPFSIFYACVLYSLITVCLVPLVLLLLHVYKYCVLAVLAQSVCC